MVSHPNIVLIMADDMGYSDLGCYGGEIETPNLDRLASQGARFSQFYNNAVCAPTRSSLLTGLYPAQVGLGEENRPTLRPDNNVTIAPLTNHICYRKQLLSHLRFIRQIDKYYVIGPVLDTHIRTPY